MKQYMDKDSLAALANYRFSRAQETLNEAVDIASRGYYNTAVNRLYYACYYAANALLIKNDITAHTHAGVKQLLGLHFVTTHRLDPNHARFYAQLFNNRIAGDYDDFVTFDKETLDRLIPQAKQFIDAIGKLLR